MSAIIAAFLFAVFAAAPLSASGRSEETEETPESPSFVMYITALDVSALPPARQLMGDTVARNLANSLLRISFRARQEDEYTYYRDFAWENYRVTAARALQDRRNDRDLLIFKGEPRWRYRKSLRDIDKAIAELETQMAEVNARAPVVEQRPLFSLGERNRNNIFPPPPAPGQELRFSLDEKVNAFLTGRLSEYHDRLFLELQVYTLHSRSFSYEDSILFSTSDLLAAMDEISNRLLIAVSGIPPAGVLVRTNPSDAMVIIDGVFAGRGDMEMAARSPGEVSVEVRADSHSPVSFPLELNSGEIAELFIDLTPLGLSVFQAVVPESPGSLVYHGSLFTGETPFTLQLPGSRFAYITVETPEGETGSIIYRNGEIIRGRARFAKNNGADNGAAAIFDTRVPVDPAQRRVERARRGFYGAYGALWFVLPAALLTAGVAGTYMDANTLAMGNPAGIDPDTQNKIYNDALRANTARVVAYSAMGAALGVTFFQIFRYLYVSSKDPAPLVVHPKEKDTTDAKEEP